MHQRLISDYRGFTEGSAVIRDDRIAKFMEEDHDHTILRRGQGKPTAQTIMNHTSAATQYATRRVTE